jgi:hypothetical protein
MLLQQLRRMIRTTRIGFQNLGLSLILQLMMLVCIIVLREQKRKLLIERIFVGESVEMMNMLFLMSV